MDIVDNFILIVAVALIIVLVGWLEIRYMKKRRKDQVDVGIIRDDAYNAVATIKAVASSLRDNGREVMEAEMIIYRAESAYESGNYAECKEFADQARSSLLRSKSKNDLADMSEPPAPTTVEKLSTEVPANMTKKMPANYLESKFIIETADGMVQAAGEEARTEAELLCQEAKGAFEAGDYTAALRSAMRAKRALEGSAGKQKGRAFANAEVLVLPKKKEERPAEEAAAEVTKCENCGAAVGPEDGFCFACGKRQGPKVCPSCSKEVAEDDAFCRKCGTRIEV